MPCIRKILKDRKNCAGIVNRTIHFSYLIILVLVQPANAKETYQRPAKEIQEILDAPFPSSAFPSPSGDAMILARPFNYLSISDLAEPFLRLAGLRINTGNNALHADGYWVGFRFKRLPDGAEVPIALPKDARLSSPIWNANGTFCVFSNETPTAVELWVLDIKTTKARKLPGISLNPVLGYAFRWLPDQKTLLVKLIPKDRKAPPAAPKAPGGPLIEDSAQVAKASSTYETKDLLKTPHDADLFDFYASSELALVQIGSGKITRIGDAAVYTTVSAAPGGGYLLIERLHRPYSFLRTYARFPKEVEIWDLHGKKIETLARLPLAEQVPIDGVRTGPRNFSWRPTSDATLVWVEALDDGDLANKVPFRDRVITKTVGAAAQELSKLEQRYAGMEWIAQSSLVLISDFERDRHWIRTKLQDADKPAAPPRLVWDLSADDRYGDPGEPVLQMQPNGVWAVMVRDGFIFLKGRGSSPVGDRPFLDRMDLQSFKTERLFRSDKSSRESFVAWVNPDLKTFITRRQTPTEPPNYVVRTLGKPLPTEVEPGEPTWASTSRPITHESDPTPQLRGISKQLVTFKRSDGVPLSFTLYLPPNYKPGTKLPTVLWAYPLDYTDPSMAGQVEGSPKEFTLIWGPDPVLFTLSGYAVLDQVAMPVVGPTDTAYDTFIEQITMNAKAAIDQAVAMGVTDPDRVGVMGHSHGALMTVNLIAHTKLFRAGIARSGAYNHTMRPFGFQNEHRTLYQAKDIYLKLSPLLNANLIKDPLLIIHGEMDANPGTVPLQSEKLFEAIRGVGGTGRLVILPFESHTYMARESVEHTLYEQFAWFDKYVKNARPRGPSTPAAQPTK